MEGGGSWECGIVGGNADCLGSGRRRRVIPSSAKYDPGNKNGHSALSYSPHHKKNLLAAFGDERPPFRKTHL